MCCERAIAPLLTCNVPVRDCALLGIQECRSGDLDGEGVAACHSLPPNLQSFCNVKKPPLCHSAMVPLH